MKKKLLFLIFAALLPHQLILADGTKDPAVELHSLIIQVGADIKAGKRTEPELSDDLKQFDALLAEHKGEKTDAVAQILYMKALLYSEVIKDTAKSDALMQQLTNDFSGTPFVAKIQQQQVREDAAGKIQ